MDRVDHESRPSRTNENEQRMLELFRDGDDSAFQTLVRPLLPGLLALAHRSCRDRHWAEDLVQETLIRALKGRAGFRGDCSLRTWLFRILVRLASEPKRWRREDGNQQPELLEIPDTLGSLPLHDAMARELQDRIDEAMERLTYRQRTALHLRAVEGMDYRAVSGVLQCSPVAARMHVLEARRKVLARVKEHLDP